MKVFLSWSGQPSRSVAEFLRDWLPDVIHVLDPWMSATDLEAGARWGRRIERELEQTKCGILCLTNENQRSPWLLFEAGALAKTLKDTYVCPYLLDLNPTDVQGPITQFQASRANERGSWKIVSTLNSALGADSLPESRLRRSFERCWPELESVLGGLSFSEESPKGRSMDGMVDEILSLTREFTRRQGSAVIERSLESEIDEIKMSLNRLSLQLHSAQITGDISKDDEDLLWPKELTILFPGAGDERVADSITFGPNDTLFDTMSEIWHILQQGGGFSPDAFTYLWDWVLVRKSDAMPLIVLNLGLFPSRFVFQDGEGWEVVRLDEPLLKGGDRFGLDRNSEKSFNAHKERRGTI